MKGEKPTLIPLEPRKSSFPSAHTVMSHTHTFLPPPDSGGSRPEVTSNTFWCKVTGHLPCKGQTKQDLGTLEMALTYPVKKIKPRQSQGLENIFKGLKPV